MRWPGSVKTRFAFHIELGYTIVDLDIRYFAIQGYTVYVCGHRADLRVNCPGIGPKQARERGKPSHVECICAPSCKSLIGERKTSAGIDVENCRKSSYEMPTLSGHK